MQWKVLASLMLASALVTGQAQTSTGSTAKAASTKTSAKRKKTAPKVTKPSIESQIQQLREEMQTQIQGLKQQLADRDSQLQAAKSQAAAAQAAAQDAQSALQSQQQAVAQTTQSVSTLESSVADLKTNTSSIVTTIQDEQAKVKTAIENPSALHYKGITITPGGYAAAETVYRTRATGADIPTPFNAIPFPNANLAKQGEFFGSARQSRVSMLAEGKVDWGTLRGYWEADWLGTGTSSNNNQSNSYVLRQRVIWGQAALNSGWTFTGGQLWSMVTEDKKGISNFSGDILTPQTIDPNYVAGFVWTRQYGFRVTKSLNHDKVTVGVALENPETLGPVVNGDNTGYPTYLYASGGANGGNYNAGLNGESCSSTSTTTPVSISCVPGYLATYSLNSAPDVIAKVAFDPGYGHYEIFGIARFFRDRIYPNTTGTTKTSVGAYNDDETGGGIGGSLRVPTLHKKLDVGVKGLWGAGVGRYGDSTIADLTVKPNGMFVPLHGFSALGTLELHATPRLDIYANYGGDEIFRTAYVNPTTGNLVGYGVGPISKYTNAGCNTEPVPSANNNPATPSNCQAANRDVQEGTIGYWYDFYKGPKGRLRQSIQYGYIVRQTWQDAAGRAPKAVENAIWTSFRYYLP